MSASAEHAVYERADAEQTELKEQRSVEEPLNRMLAELYQAVQRLVAIEERLGKFAELEERLKGLEVREQRLERLEALEQLWLKEAAARLDQRREQNKEASRRYRERHGDEVRQRDAARLRARRARQRGQDEGR